MDIPTLTSAALLADDAWQAALVAVYGKHAGDARYDARGVATPNLRRLYEARLIANLERHAATMAVIHPESAA